MTTSNPVLSSCLQAEGKKIENHSNVFKQSSDK